MSTVGMTVGAQGIRLQLYRFEVASVYIPQVAHFVVRARGSVLASCMGKQDALHEARQIVGHAAPLQGAAFQPLSILLNPLPKVGAAQYAHRRLGNIECGGVPLEEAEESCLLPCKCGRLYCRRDPQPVQLRGSERLQVDQLLLQRASDSLELSD